METCPGDAVLRRRPVQLRSNLPHMGNKERAPTELMRQKSRDAVWDQVFEELLEPAVGQRHDIALEPIDLNRRHLEKIAGHLPPFVSRVVAGNCAVGGALCHMMQTALFLELPLKHTSQRTKNIKIPPRLVVDHDDTGATRPQYAVHLLQHSSGVGAMMDNSPAPNKIEAIVGEIHMLCIHLQNRT